MSAERGELAPSTRFELLVELRFASHQMMNAGTAFIVKRERPAGHACVSDSITLDGLVSRLEEGTMSVELGLLFLEAAQTIIERRMHELEASS